jgi:hypothetical protein
VLIAEQDETGAGDGNRIHVVGLGIPRLEFLKKVAATTKHCARGYKLRAKKNFSSEKKSFQTFQTFQSTLTAFLGL